MKLTPLFFGRQVFVTLLGVKGYVVFPKMVPPNKSSKDKNHLRILMMFDPDVIVGFNQCTPPFWVGICFGITLFQSS